MEKLIQEQTSSYELMKNFIKNYKKDSKAKKTVSYFENRLKSFTEYWIEFRQTHKKILKLSAKDTDQTDYFSNDVYSEVEGFYINSISEIEEERSLLHNTITPNKSEAGGAQKTEAIQEEIKLPRINLPRFSGDYKSWSSFHDLFRATIHRNVSLSKAQKLHYLKTSVSGDAEQLLRHFTITDANYIPAWSLLVDRYDNKRLIVKTELRLLFSQPFNQTDTATNVRKLLDTTNECLQSLRNLDISTEGWDVLINHIVVERLPLETRSLWEQRIGDRKDLPTFDELKAFLEARFRTLEALATSSPRANKPPPSRQTFYAQRGISCFLCSGAHVLRQCPKFKQLEYAAKWDIVQKRGLCSNCLSQGHIGANCPSLNSCFICKNKHHTLLHKTGNTNAQIRSSNMKVNLNLVTEPESQADLIEYADVGPASNSLHVGHAMADTPVLLATALVRIVSRFGNSKVFRALIDPGSEATFITEDAVQSLRLEKESVRANIEVVGQIVAGKVNTQVKLIVKPLNDEHRSVTAKGFIMKKLTNLLPSRRIERRPWSHTAGLQLADPTYEVPGRIDILLGADVYPQVVSDGLKIGPTGSPIAQNTMFGWVLVGEISDGAEITSKNTDHPRIENFHTTCSLDVQLKAFWEIEEIPEKRIMLDEEMECEKHYEETYQRDANGRFIVRLPFIGKPECLQLGNSRHRAVARLHQMENRFQNDLELKTEYARCLREYLELGHMIPAQSAENDHIVSTSDRNMSYTCSYLPHHCVLKESSSTTRLRVVFDASRKTTSGKSLNDVLLKGPTIQNELTSILLQWRKHRIAFMSDIEKMYRQIWVDPRDAEYQRIVWRETSQEALKDYKLLTVTFGTKSAPYLAIKTIKQLALDERDKYPIGSEAATNDFYVDDLMSGADTEEKALIKQNELISLMRSAGFELRKWASNSNKILENVPKTHRELELPLSMNLDEGIRALGMKWNPVADHFSYQVKQELNSSTLTKRLILSEVSKLFDPLGWIAPVVIIAKILIQSLWLTGIDWDEEVPKNIVKEWLDFKNNLPVVESIQIPRWIRTADKPQIMEIHGFSDASEKAYAAAVYLRVVNPNEEINCSLLMSKTKVAPIKTVSLPRLELCAAALLAKLIRYIKETLKLNDITVHAWTDSKIVLSWLRGQPSRWKTFVANRVSLIHTILGTNTWRHVPSKENPADCATRGLNPQELRRCSLWWTGPEWLKGSKTAWPKSEDIPNTNVEIRNLVSLFTKFEVDWDLMEKHSCLLNLIRVTAYIIRFISNCRKPKTLRESKYLKVYEMEAAMKMWIRKVQLSYFKEDISKLKRNQGLERRSKLIKLNPFVHEDGLLRVGGRLKNADLNFDEKYPIILPEKCHLTTLILDKTHHDTLHGGPQLMLNVLHKQYWILKARNAVRHHIYKCVVCHRQKMTCRDQLMGDLPRARVNASKPFRHTGVDYCGPFDLRTSKLRGTKTYKAYIAVFICLATKAMHIELVTDLSTQGFLAAYRRFVSRRGSCSDLYSDCGSNFVGANTVLSRQMRQMIDAVNERTAEAIEMEGTKWHFIPPASPHFGGLWEAGVKATKRHLKRVLGQSPLTYEEMSTVLAQIEACLNSRPLCEISSDPADMSALTPGHFLVGEAILTPPEPNLLETNINRLDRWHFIQRLYQTFWQRWHTEYLCRLQQRPKWNQKRENPNVGELVLIKEERVPPSRWLLGRIVECHPGSDGLVRVVTVKTKENIIKRPVCKICPLPIAYCP